MKRLQLGLLFVLLQAPASAFAQPNSYDVDRYDSSVSGEPVASVDVFYDQLSPYGVWIEDPSFGRVFVPDTTQFVPYTEGHWQYTTVGFVWISSEPFAWATSHYGRWAYSRPHGRWVWRPDVVWGPSWVEWRQSGDYFGWAPLAPDLAIEIGYAPPLESWHYCGAAHIFDTSLSRYYEPPLRVVEIHRDSRRIEHYANIGGARVVVGPSAATLHERHIDVRPTKIEAHAAGRWTADESRVAVQRAQQQRAANDERNRTRIVNSATLRQATPTKQPQVTQEPKQPQIRQEPKQPQIRQEPKQPQLRREPKQPQLRQEPKQPEVRQEPTSSAVERKSEHK